MAMGCYDVIVLGAGVQGSSTAYYLTQKAGIERVLLLEQFPVGHVRGSSNGNSRITRRAHQQAYYVEMMNEAFKMWSALEKESNTMLYKRTGLLWFLGATEVKNLEIRSDGLKTHNIPYQVFSGSEANVRYQEQLSLPADYKCLLEEDGGILMAAKAIDAYQKLFVSGGGEFKDEHPVTEIIPGEVVVVKTSKGTFRTKKLVITAGAWAPALLKTLGVDLPFKIFRTEAIYWKVECPEAFSPDKFPTFGANDGAGNESWFYGIPIYEYPGLVKICCHSGREIEPDVRDADPLASTVERTSEFIEKYFKGVSTTPSIVEPCMYTGSPTRDPVLDKHPDHPNIVFGAGFSGHGFKLSPVIGKVLSELILDLPPSYDLSPFRLSRYNET